MKCPCTIVHNKEMNKYDIPRYLKLEILILGFLWY
jgi:hypothetical protein